MNYVESHHQEPERYAAQQIERLRDELNLSYGELSKRMAEAGCPMDKSSLQKIEKGVPRRKISVNELVAFAKVFNVPMAELIGGTQDTKLELAWRDLMNAESLANVVRVAKAEYSGHVMDLRRIADASPEFRDQVAKRYSEHRKIQIDKAKRQARLDDYKADTEEELKDYLVLWDFDTAVTTTARDVLGIDAMFGVDDNGE